MDLLNVCRVRLRTVCRVRFAVYGCRKLNQQYPPNSTPITSYLNIFGPGNIQEPGVDIDSINVDLGPNYKEGAEIKDGGQKNSTYK